MEEHLTPIIIFGSAELRFASEVDSALSNFASSKGYAVKTLIEGLKLIGRKMSLESNLVDKIIKDKLWKLEQYDNSIAEYEKNLKEILRDEFPLSESSLTALSYLQNGLNLSNDDVKKIHDKILNDDKNDSAFSWYDRGLGQQSLENYNKSIEYFSKAIDKKAEYSAAFYSRGYCKGKADLYQEGIDDLTSAIHINENWGIGSSLSIAHFDRGLIYMRFEDENFENYKLAVRDFKQVIIILVV
ncbi:MAG: hypothetical protein AAGK97_12730 [Bacteroidota bacterium]